METMKDIKAQFASAKEGEYNALFSIMKTMREAVYRN